MGAKSEELSQKHIDRETKIDERANREDMHSYLFKEHTVVNTWTMLVGRYCCQFISFKSAAQSVLSKIKRGVKRTKRRKRCIFWGEKPHKSFIQTKKLGWEQGCCVRIEVSFACSP